MNLKELIPDDWRELLKEEFEKPYFQKLEEFINNEYKTQAVFPARENIFAAFHNTPLDKVKVFLLGQDPYHGAGQAHGLSFSVNPGVKQPPSLKNIFKELKSDLGCEIPGNGDLRPWANQGILLLNAVLTVRSGEAASHKNQGWEKFTDAVIQKVSDNKENIVFLLWGAYARKKKSLIDQSKHVIIEGIHPSPLSANTGFFGSKPFSAINDALVKAGKEPVNWKLPL